MSSGPRIEAITVWYNEQLLAGFFLNHYSFLDKIHVVLDSDTNDDTLSVISRYKNVELSAISFPEKFDDELKVARINDIYSKLDCDWVISVDSDEFVFPLPFGTTMRDFLLNEKKNDVLYAQLWQVYRHRSDSDLDPNQPPVMQRRHGDPNVTAGVNALYTKPIIVKGRIGLRWGVGCHFLEETNNKARKIWNRLFNKPRISPNKVYGVHWQKADPQLIKSRVANRINRLSARNIERSQGLQFRLEEKKLLEECEAFMESPLLF